MRIKNAKVFVGKTFIDADIEFDQKITAVGRLEGEADLDCAGCYVIPGLVDIHTHGAMGEDFSDGKGDKLQLMADYYAAHGVTSFLATTMTLKEEVLTPAMHAIRDFARKGGAKCAGIHLEGPFLGYAKRGAQAAENLHKPDPDLFDRLNAASGGKVKLVTVACEEEGGMDFVANVSKKCTVSLGHTSADYDQAMEAFARGASHATHLYNGMDGLHHRKPGIIAAAMDAGASVELICDGLHIHPAAIRLAHKLYGDKLNLVSDSLRCAGMPEGQYDVGGQQIIVKGGLARLLDGTIAGSASTLYDGLRKAISFGIPEEDAVRACTYNPACALHAEDEIGSIASGKNADFLICSGDYSEKRVFLGGKELTN